MKDAESRGGNVHHYPDGDVIETREYIYINRDNKEVLIQEHLAPHVGANGPHFNVRNPNSPRRGSFPGTKEHYPFKDRKRKNPRHGLFEKKDGE